ncbi:hypothetical protein BR93DRAFT_925718 [Coniochaeta sp. PMI_546]|nr:hypothetical protein BR93DRAFT_925718 [Coniochaeta sp. PMI_546]
MYSQESGESLEQIWAAKISQPHNTGHADTHTHTRCACSAYLPHWARRKRRERTDTEGATAGLQCTEVGLRSAACGSEIDRSPSRLPAPPRLAVQVISQKFAMALSRRPDVRGAGFSAAMSCNPEVCPSVQSVPGWLSTVCDCYQRCTLVFHKTTTLSGTSRCIISLGPPW